MRVCICMSVSPVLSVTRASSLRLISGQLPETQFFQTKYHFRPEISWLISDSSCNFLETPAEVSTGPGSPGLHGVPWPWILTPVESPPLLYSTQGWELGRAGTLQALFSQCQKRPVPSLDRW